MVLGCWWLVGLAGGWWLVAGGWCLVAGCWLLGGREVDIDSDTPKGSADMIK